jgi:hypothetical protein
MATAFADVAARSIAAGIGATALVDLWALLLRRALGWTSLDWAMAGRWIAHLPRGRFVHERIAAASAVRGERGIGWVFHYGVGIVFAGALVAVMGADWASRPTLLACLATGWLTIVFPWFVMQPAMGAGFAAARTARPRRARLQSLLTHTVFGIGLYLALHGLAALLPPAAA